MESPVLTQQAQCTERLLLTPVFQRDFISASCLPAGDPFKGLLVPDPTDLRDLIHQLLIITVLLLLLRPGKRSP